VTDLQRIKEVIVITSLYYGRNDLSPPVLAMMAEDLKAFPADTVIAAYGAYRKNGKNRVFPLPAQIIEIIEGGNSKTNSNIMVTKLIAAVKRHDSNWQHYRQAKFYKHGSFQADFIAELGEEAWHLIEIHGGWSNFCSSYWNAQNESTFRAQIRDLAEGVMEQSRAGVLTAPKESLQIEMKGDFLEEAAKRGINLLVSKQGNEAS
jgi:hypothetical protein